VKTSWSMKFGQGFPDSHKFSSSDKKYFFFICSNSWRNFIFPMRWQHIRRTRTVQGQNTRRHLNLIMWRHFTLKGCFDAAELFWVTWEKKTSKVAGSSSTETCQVSWASPHTKTGLADGIQSEGRTLTGEGQGRAHCQLFTEVPARRPTVLGPPK